MKWTFFNPTASARDTRPRSSRIYPLVAREIRLTRTLVCRERRIRPKKTPTGKLTPLQQDSDSARALVVRRLSRLLIKCWCVCVLWHIQAVCEPMQTQTRQQRIIRHGIHVCVDIYMYIYIHIWILHRRALLKQLALSYWHTSSPY